MNSFLRWFSCGLAVLLSSCAAGYVSGPYRAQVFDVESKSPHIELIGVEHGLFAGPCGFLLSRSAWEINLRFDAQPDHVFDVRRAKELKTSGITKNWSEGTISVIPNRRRVEVHLSRTEQGKKIPWEHNGTYRYLH